MLCATTHRPQPIVADAHSSPASVAAENVVVLSSSAPAVHAAAEAAIKDVTRRVAE